MRGIQSNYFKISMKKLLVVLFITFTTTLQAKNYYISAAGNDTNDGLTTSTPWKTINKVNSFSFASSDYILFRRGDTFYGGIEVKNANLTYDAYGTGAKPVITGLSTVTGWVNLGGNIWEAPVVNVKPDVNLVLRAGLIQQVGRYPNSDAPNGGYLTYTAATSTSITGPALSSTTNWTGAEVAIRINRWEIRRQIVTSHSSGVVSFASNTTPRINYGYFFQRDKRTLDKDGEWWHDAANKKLRMYFSSNNPGSYTIQIATVDTLFKSLQGGLTINNLSFNGSGKKTIWTNGGSGVTIKNCDVNNSGAEAITTWFCVNALVDNCTVKNSLGSGIRVFNSTVGSVNLSITNCYIDSTVLFAGMETSNVLNGGAGITCMGGDNLSVNNNIIKNSGYNGIQWQGNNVTIKNNFITTFCSVRDDGGGIYTVENGGSSFPVRSNRNLIANIVTNGIGANKGSDDAKGVAVSGLYFDLGSRTIVIDNNTVANINGNSFHGNNNAYLTITNNTFFGNKTTLSFQRFSDAPLVRNIIMKKNILYPFRTRYRNLGINVPSLITKEADLLAMGVLDSNYYSLRNGTDTSLTAVTTYANLSNYTETANSFSYLPGTVKTELHSKNVSNTGILEYNASSVAKVVEFNGLSKKDVFGTVYNNSVSIPAWSSKVLLDNGVTSLLPAVNLLPAINPSNIINGLDYKYYEGSWTVLPDFTTLTHVKAGATTNFNLALANRTLQYGFNFWGYINIPVDGQYKFYTSSDDGSKLYIDKVLVVSNDSIHGTREKSGSIGLKAGKHAINGIFFQQAGGAVFNVSYESSSIAKQTIPSSVLYRDNAAVARIANGTSVNSSSAQSISNISNITSALKITSFPNPTISEFRLFVEGGTNEKIEILVMDMNGSIVFQTQGTSNKTYKFGNSFMRGVYIIKTIQGNAVQILKVIKG